MRNATSRHSDPVACGFHAIPGRDYGKPMPIEISQPQAENHRLMRVTDFQHLSIAMK